MPVEMHFSQSALAGHIVKKCHQEGDKRCSGQAPGQSGEKSLPSISRSAPIANTSTPGSAASKTLLANA